MQLNMYILLDYLNLPILDTHITSSKNTCQLLDVSLYQKNSALLSNIVYIIMDDRDFVTGPPNTSGNFLFTRQAQGARIPAGSYDYAIIDSADGISLLKEIQEIFRYFRNWELELYSLLDNQASPKAIAKTASPFLGNPLCLYTPSLRALFFCNHGLPSLNPDYYLGDQEGDYMSDEYADRLRTDDDYLKTMDALEPSMFPENIFGYRVLYYNIRMNHDYIARLISCEVNRPIRSSDFAILKFLAGFIGKSIQQQNIQTNNHPPYFDSCLMSLIQNDRPDSIRLNLALEKYGWKKENRYIVVYLPLSHNEQLTHASLAICNRLENAYLRCAAVTVESHIVFLVNLDYLKCTRDKIISSLVYFLRDNLLKAGISNTFDTLLDLASYYHQAKAAYEIGSQKDPMFWCYRYENYTLYHYTSLILADHSVSSLCPPKLLRLIRYDHEHNTAFTLSLKAFLENNLNITKTIEKLYIHRATFQYQLKRINEITELAVNDKNERLCLLLFFQAMDEKKLSPEQILLHE